MRELLVSSNNLAELGFPTDDEGKDEHVGRLRPLIQKYTTDEELRREVKFGVFGSTLERIKSLRPASPALRAPDRRRTRANTFGLNEVEFAVRTLAGRGEGPKRDSRDGGPKL